MADATALLAVPVDDGAIQRAFEALDAQMDAWLTGMKRAEQAVAASFEVLSSVPAISAASTEPVQEPASETVGTRKEQSKEAAAGPVAVATQSRNSDPVPVEATSVPVETGSAAETKPAVEAKPAPGAKQVLGAKQALEPAPAVVMETTAVVGGTPAPVKTEVASQGAPDAAATPPAKSVSEDEAILATLDAETAKAIRVMRRMCMNTKSVKDLLAEYQAKKEDQSAATASKKSWFRRGR